MNLRI
jgi:hypothetical protein